MKAHAMVLTTPKVAEFASVYSPELGSGSEIALLTEQKAIMVYFRPWDDA